jgi:subtilisin family serine protease
VVRDLALRVVTTHRARTPVLGVDPELVLVLELNREVDPDLIRRAELMVLELASEKVLVAFAGDPELTEFRRRCEAYQQGARPPMETGKPERAAEYEDLFDAIEKLRPLASQDTISEELRRVLESTPVKQTLRLDVQCWCPEVVTEARRRYEEVFQAVVAAGGNVPDRSLRESAGLSMLRVELPADMVYQLAEVDRVKSIDVLPRPVLTHPQVWNASPEDLPEVLSPSPTATTVAVVDSGVRSAHPLLAPAVIGVEVAGPSLADGGDESGHGTLVASLSLHGSLDQSLSSREPLRPAGRLFSVRVLDANDNFPDTRLWEEHLHDAIMMAVSAGARVVNLSLGDTRRPYQPPRPTPLGAVIDGLAREHNLIIVISAGNYPAAAYTVDDSLRDDYPLRLLNDPAAGLLNPAPAALALTTGALCADRSQGVRPVRDRIDVVPMGGPDRPSPATRAGPGVANMIKPELVAPGGGWGLDELAQRLVKDQTLSVVGAGGAEPERLLAWSTGTSFAAPLVSHMALRVLDRYPFLSANGVRALVLASVQPVATVVTGPGQRTSAAEQARLTGYGRPSAGRAEASEDHRAVLFAENEIDVDGVHLYRIPLPATFFDSGGRRRLAVALAYDPEVRPTRLEYLASHMRVNAYRGASHDAIAEAYAQAEPIELDPADGDDTDLVASTGIRRYLVDLQPAERRRAKGANQYAGVVFGQRLSEDKGRDLILVVRNINRWATPGDRQRYALAVVLERDADHRPLYDELRAELGLLAEVELEVGYPDVPS